MKVVTYNQCGRLIHFVWIAGALLRLPDKTYAGVTLEDLLLTALQNAAKHPNQTVLRPQ